MSMNIAPTPPHFVVNAAAPTTEALLKDNKVKEVVPAPTQVEAAVPQKSREQDDRSPANTDASTYDTIKKDNQIINEISEDDSQNQDADKENQDENNPQAQDDNKDSPTTASESSSEEIDQQEQQVIQELKARDIEVRNHERAHAAVGGQHAGAPNYEYQTGPDGKKYAVGGEVSIDVSKTNDPQSTIRKMQTVRAAALAPAEPSAQDRKVAAQASRYIAEAKVEMIESQQDLAYTTNQSESQSGKELKVETDDSIDAQTDSAAAGEQKNNSLAYEQTARVVKNKYASSYQPIEHNFNAVA
jgi:hypothetical protein